MGALLLAPATVSAPPSITPLYYSHLETVSAPRCERAFYCSAINARGKSREYLDLTSLLLLLLLDPQPGSQATPLSGKKKSGRKRMLTRLRRRRTRRRV
jgi:hypothetical protein